MKFLDTIKNRHENFGARIFFLFTIFIFIISISFTSIFFHQQRKTLTENMSNEGMLLARLMAYNSKLGVFAESEGLLTEAVTGIFQHEEVLHVTILNADGKPLFEQSNKHSGKSSKVEIPDWNTKLGQIQRIATPSSFEGEDIFECWAPVVSTSSSMSAESLFIASHTPGKENTIGFIRIIIDKTPLKKKLDKLLLTSVLLALFFLLLGTGITYLIVRGITKPLNKLTEGIKSLELGGKFEPVLVETGDEIGRLAAAFNNMAESLQKRETEKEQLAEELRQAQKMEAIGTLAGGVAHDFNNILTAIIGFGTLLQRSLKTDNPFRVYVDQILTASDRATTLVQRLLAFGRKQIINPKPSNLNDIVRSIEKLLTRLISEDIEFRVILADYPIVSRVDSGQVDQILMNLVTNARDAMPNGGTLTISTGRDYLDGSSFGPAPQDKPGWYGWISVTDTGTGMDEKTCERVFDPFFTTKEVGKGTGLGLSMVYGIIKQHDGFIEVDSEQGMGTSFKLCLPLVESNEQLDSLETNAPPRGNRETILIAEDDKAVRKLSKHVLERNGYSVIEAIDGADAVKRFSEHQKKIDLVLLDVVMPKKNGQTAYEEMQTIQPDVRALFISGYTKDIINRKGILDEKINFIAKPVKPDELLSKVQEVLHPA